MTKTARMKSLSRGTAWEELASRNWYDTAVTNLKTKIQPEHVILNTLGHELPAWESMGRDEETEGFSPPLTAYLDRHTSAV